MLYSYKPLEEKLLALKMNKSSLVDKLGISSKTIAKIIKKEKIANHVLERIANFLNCKVEDLYVLEYENKILQRLLEEKSGKISGGLYHELQVRLTYSSNRIEGSKLSEDQTRLIFETRTINVDNVTSVDDIIETSNHFKCIDYIISVALEPLSEEIIKHIHYLLKVNTKDSFLDWFNVGDYKKVDNYVGGYITVPPANVPSMMKELVNSYNYKKDKNFEDIIDFHARFEKIHPFQDGNGRVGRLIAFKECLRYNIVPFIILDNKKAFYYRGLSLYPQNKECLIDTCLDGQDTFKKLLNSLKIEF